MLSPPNEHSLSASIEIITPVFVLSTYEIIECFGKIMLGYLVFMSHSEIVKKSNHMDIIMYNGANIVIHVFTIHMYSNSSLETICQQCCKSYVCYLEYIEQLDKTNLVNNLYISDISIFVYKQTIGELLSNVQHSTSNRDIFKLLTCVWNTIFIWNSNISLDTRVAICNIYLNKYVKLLTNIHESITPGDISGNDIASTNSIATTSELGPSIGIESLSEDDISSQDKDIYVYLDYVKIIQEKWQMDEHVYFIFLNEYYKVLDNLYKASKLPNRTYMMEQMALFCANYLQYNPNVNNIKSIVKQLF